VSKPMDPTAKKDDTDLVAQVTLITKYDEPTLLSKRIFLDGQEQLQSDGSSCRMVYGSAARTSAATAHDLAQIIANCSSDQAIALGRLKDDLPDQVEVTVPSRLKHHPGAITRSRDFIDYLHGRPAWALIDYDTKGIPNEVAERIQAAGGMLSALLSVAPQLELAARVSRASTTAGLFNSASNEPISGSNGLHHYVLVRDGTDIERFLKDLHNRCWLLGLGWHMIGKTGQLLERSLIDRTVGYGERLCFEGAPHVIAPLAQDYTKRVPEVIEGKEIDSDRVVPRLTEYERHLVREARRVSAGALDKSAAVIRGEHDNKLAAAISSKSEVPVLTALRLVRARHRGVLFPDLELEFDHLGVVTVGSVLANLDHFIGETLADPIEGIDYGRCKAMVMKADDGTVLIHSFAHGRCIYLPRHDLKSAKAAFAEAPGDALVDHALAILAQAEFEDDELAEFVAQVAKAAKVGVRALTSRVKKDRSARLAEKQKASMEADMDGRIIRPRPDPDGELLPTVTFVDEVLAHDQSAEPPMRNASGAFVQIEVKEPWALHLLTADSANANEETEAIKPPAEPVLDVLRPVGVELLLERYFRWLVETRTGSYFAGLPARHINALMEYSESTVPVVRAINTGPLVTLSGRVIDGVGLDRKNGLFHRIDPVLRASVPADPPTAQEVADALRFLLDEWFVDVALDLEDKCVGIMLALTLLERALLAERPAFFVTAGQRGGGKTTLVHMIMIAILGRRAAAASWSDNAEERKKALFSHFRQGVAALVWDNIARGSTISCPHIEAALTASEISDRVLGVSQVETAPASTVQIFTGNSIAPRGDMASRSFIVPLNVDRPDPENRAFTHADPLAWTQANRAKILGALYTILIGGALQRPTDQVAKTRFKFWWKLIGWPVEFAAGLLGITVDCTELLRAAEASEEEASASSRALTVLREHFGGTKFSTRDVVLVLADSTSLVEEVAAEAEELSDALGELVGKRLEKPTARSIGKLFQKTLTNRPAWIEDGKVFATLQKIPGHDANKYQIEVSVPRSSHKPERDGSSVAQPTVISSGKVEKDGNVLVGGRRAESLFPEETVSSFPGGGKVRKDGNVSTTEDTEETANLAKEAGDRSTWRGRI